MTEPIRIAISGAAGRLGYALIFRMAVGGLFGRDQPVALSLLDVPEHRPLLEADEIELRDCAFPLLADLSIATEPEEAFVDADWVILLAGRPVGSTMRRRSELIQENAPIYAHHGQAINNACPNARIMVVANPCNTNCLVAQRYAAEVPVENWFALNRLDRMRATALIAEKAGVPVGEVNRVNVWGNHSEMVFVDFCNSFIGDRPAPEVITDPDWPRGPLHAALAERSRAAVNLRGSSPAGTAAQAILGSIRAITTPTPFNRRFGASVLTDGHAYSIPSGLVFGMPLCTEDGETWEVVHGLYLDDYAQERLAANVNELRQELGAALEVVSNL